MKKQIVRLILAALFLLIPAIVLAKKPIRVLEGTVTRVSAGDTIKVLDDQGTEVKVRMYGIDAPETEKTNKKGKVAQPYGDEARKALEGKIAGKRVKLDVMGIGMYKTFVSIVSLDGRNINEEMVAEGHAWVNKHNLKKPYKKEYTQLEEEARANKLGLWKQGNPQPPWEFKKASKKGGHVRPDK